MRTRQIKNFVTILMLSRGVPMLLGGDEIRRTQGGNNNPYNQDNATSWFDWTMADSNQDMLRYVQRMIAFRKGASGASAAAFLHGARSTNAASPTSRGTARSWAGPGFDDPDGRALACTIAGFGGDADLHVMMNMFWEPLDFEVPVDPQRTWQIAIDTFAASPHDIPDPDQRAHRLVLSLHGARPKHRRPRQRHGLTESQPAESARPRQRRRAQRLQPRS